MSKKKKDILGNITFIFFVFKKSVFVGGTAIMVRLVAVLCDKRALMGG